MAENARKKPSGDALARVLRNSRGATTPEALEYQLHAGRPLQPSAEYVALANQAMGRQSPPPDFEPLGGGYDPLPVRAGAGMTPRQQVVERSGAGAPGMVYAEMDGGPVLLSLDSAERQGLRVISAEEAAQLGQGLVGQEAFAGAQASGSSGAAAGLAGARAKGSPDPRMLAALLRTGR